MWSRGNSKSRWQNIGIHAVILMLLFIGVADDDDLAFTGWT
jgi:hypothetical protein